MKTERRHELQTNTLADALAQTVDTVKPYTQIAVGAALAAVVVFGVVKYLSVRSQENVIDSWNLYLQASTSNTPENNAELAKLIEQYPDSTAARWSQLFLADQALNEGIEKLFQNRTEANEKLAQAEKHYQAVQQSGSDPLLMERATLGLARVYESQVKLDPARQEYQRLLKDWPNGAFARTAEERFNDLNQPSTKDFYDWFANNEPKGTGTNSLGTPGARPDFDLSEPLDTLNLNLPTTPAPPADDVNKTSQNPVGESGSSDPVSTATRVPPDKEPSAP